MRVAVVHPGELGEPELTRWRAMQRALPHLANPFLAPEFTVAVGRFRPDVRVAVLSDGPTVVGFFPFERRAFGLGLPIAAGLNDCQGLVHAAGYDWDPQALLRGCGLAMWEFDHLVGGQRPFERYQLVRAASPIMDLGAGFDAYLARLRAESRRFSRDLLYKERKLGRDCGELRFVLDVRDYDALRTLTGWKSDQYRRTGRADRFARRWIVELVECLLDTRTDGFGGLLSMLYANGEPVAGHFGLRCDGVLAGWFPAYDTRFARYSPGLVQHLRMAEAAAADGVTCIDMGKGAREYKDALKSRELVVAEGRVTRRSAATAVQACLHWTRRAPAHWARNVVLDHPPLLRAADRTLKRYGSVRTVLRSPR